MHLLPRSSRRRNAAAGGLRVRSRVRTRRVAQPCASPIAGHVALGGLKRTTSPGRLSVRRTTLCRQPHLHRTAVRYQPSVAQPSRLIRLVTAYQRAMEGRPSPCRFTPSCSSYAQEALATHGAPRGLWLTLRRLLRCRPFGPSGWDPVPLPRHHRSLSDRFLALTTHRFLTDSDNDKGCHR